MSSNRAKVFGGWVFRTVYFEQEENIYSESSVFIPDPQHEWVINEGETA